MSRVFKRWEQTGEFLGLESALDLSVNRERFSQGLGPQNEIWIWLTARGWSRSPFQCWCPRKSNVEWAIVNLRVVSSSPDRGAKPTRETLTFNTRCGTSCDTSARAAKRGRDTRCGHFVHVFSERDWNRDRRADEAQLVTRLFRRISARRWPS